MNRLLILTLIAVLCGCTGHGARPAAPVLTSPDQLAAHVGRTVTIRGVVANSKIPTILGVDVRSNDPDLRGRLAEATGVLERSVVTEGSLADFQRNGPVANRGTGTFYRLKAIGSDYEAAVRPASP